MKKFFKALALVLVGIISLTSCANKWSAIQKAFEKDGYAISNTVEQSAARIEEEINADKEEKEEMVITVHVMTKNVIQVVVILEFKSTKDLQEACEDSSTLKGFIEDSQDSDYVNGNCVLFNITGGETAVTTFKNA